MFKLLDQRRNVIIISSFLLLFGILSLSYAWFVLINRTDAFIATASKIDVSYDIYLDGTVLEPEFFTVVNDSVMIKSGVYSINVTDINAENYIDNLRIDIKVNSTIDTYIRVSIIDALTLATLDFEGNKGEVSVVDQPINYAFSRKWDVNGIIYDDLIDAEIALGGITASDEVTMLPDWFDNHLNDGYYYYPQLIERNMDSEQLTISFIEEYDGQEFSTKPFGYTLQFAIIVEAIQAANDAPVYNWLLPTPPWGGAWS